MTKKTSLNYETCIGMPTLSLFKFRAYISNKVRNWDKLEFYLEICFELSVSTSIFPKRRSIYFTGITVLTYKLRTMFYYGKKQRLNESIVMQSKNIYDITLKVKSLSELDSRRGGYVHGFVPAFQTPLFSLYKHNMKVYFYIISKILLIITFKKYSIDIKSISLGNNIGIIKSVLATPCILILNTQCYTRILVKSLYISLVVMTSYH